MESGKIYFYTATINQWLNVLENDNCKDIVLNSLSYLAKNNLVQVYSFVIMPNHIHLLWKLLSEENSQNVQLRFMKYTSQQIKFWLKENDTNLLEKLRVDKKDRTYQVWQRNPLAFEILNPNTFEQKLMYIHNNPCQGKWMLADEPINYRYSSASFYEVNKTEFNFLTHYKEYV